MRPEVLLFALASAVPLGVTLAGQAPVPASAPDIPVSGRDHVYLAEQFSNTVSVIDPSTNRSLGLTKLGDPQPANLSPLYRGQLLVHGLGYSPDHQTLAVVSIGSNSVAFIDTATNAVKHITYLGRSPHEAFFTPNGREVNAVGPIRQVVSPSATAQRRYLAIAPVAADGSLGKPVQIQHATPAQQGGTASGEN